MDGAASWNGWVENGSGAGGENLPGEGEGGGVKGIVVGCAAYPG